MKAYVETLISYPIFNGTSLVITNEGQMRLFNRHPRDNLLPAGEVVVQHEQISSTS